MRQRVGYDLQDIIASLAALFSAGDAEEHVVSDAAHNGMPGGQGLPVSALVCPRLIGRDGALTRLRRMVARIIESNDRLIVAIDGEAGVGKSRLVAEMLAYARGRGVRVVSGACFPQDRTSPFAPIADLLRISLDGMSAQQHAAVVRPFASELAPLLPDLVTAPSRSDDALADLDLDQKRHQLMLALTRCLIGAPADRSSGGSAPPTCLILEDLHWCDDASLNLLSFLASTRDPVTSRQPLLLVATYRAEDAEPALRSWLTQLDRERRGHALTLTPLSRDETLQMLGATLPGASPPVGLVDAIHELAEGNPFRVEELLGALVVAGDVAHDGQTWHWSARPVAGWRLPRSLHEAVQQRVGRLSGPARELLTLAAVVGRRFDFTLLQHLAQVDERTLLTLVKEQVSARLVVEEDGERFAFRHALTRQAVYGELLTRERLALHRTVAEMAEQVYGDTVDQHVDDLAYHFFEAGTWQKALTYARRAAERARQLYASRTTVEHLTRAIEAGLRLPDNYGLLATLYLERAQASDTLGDGTAAIADAGRALDLAQQAGDRRAALQASIDLGVLWTGRDYAQAGPYLEAACALARELDDPALLGHSLNRLGNWRLNAQEPRDALPLHHQALAIFEQMGDRAGIAATLDLLGQTAYLNGDLAGGIQYLERAAVILEQLDDRPGLVSCLATLSERGGSWELGVSIPGTNDLAADFDSGLRDAERAVALAGEIGWRAGEAFALFELASVHCMLGEYTPALAASERSDAIARSIEHRQWETGAQTTLGLISLDLLDTERAQTCLERALQLAREIRSTFWEQVAQGALGWAYVQAAQSQNPGPQRSDLLARAEAVLGALPSDAAPIRTFSERWAMFGQAQLANVRGDPALALALVNRLTAARANDAASSDMVLPTPTPRVALLWAAALTALGSYSEAEALLLRTRDILQWQGARSKVWRCELALADLLEASGRRDDAQRVYQAAWQAVEGIAADLADRPRLRDQLVQRALRSFPRGYRHTARTVTPSGRLGVLTRREHEIAALIARGQTNREIAGALVLGERTIETHVSNVLNKLGLGSRREVARWVEEHGAPPGSPSP
jgi:DNA-binding CsgD family transcriptional regulator